MLKLNIPNREQRNLKPISLRNKEKYYSDLINLEMGLTGRVDSFISNIFIQESAQLIINAIVLFELGYFDAAFYTLRQSLELSTTMVYLSDLDEMKKKEKLKDWKEQNSFPDYNKMISFLEKNETTFSEIKSFLFEYFEKLNKVKKKLNKYLHKQGFNTFYVMRSSIFHPIYEAIDFSKEFEEYVKECIGAIAIFRLAIDPFPILLAEPEIYKRTGNLITEGFSEEFIELYIGTINLEKLKKTKHYQYLFKTILEEKPKNEFTINVVKHRYIDKDHINEILDQSDLLSSHELISVFICKILEKVSIVYAGGILDSFFSSTNSNRTNLEWSSEVFDKLENEPQNFNLNFDNVFISKIKIFGEYYFFEHNEKLEENEIKKFNLLISLLTMCDK
ncbi:teicoplanin resistance protein VanZ [Acinetobacter sp. 194]|uniref:teicoplanin resistance protein VanZ n=1 Tax=Acinetobacter shaoyimingii TaxID=2715164 RepID=UPI00140AE4E6|nr:teicoplanin resistance protein VanZ [Acinetobacter shaoyimingii]NHB58836.1 teicoplanin resistance protein VanZ [Acinetobacter shaoyimingii]